MPFDRKSVTRGQFMIGGNFPSDLMTKAAPPPESNFRQAAELLAEARRKLEAWQAERKRAQWWAKREREYWQ